MTRALLFAGLITLVPASSRCTKNLCFVVDVSGSMDGRKIRQALAQFREFAGAPIDDASLKVYSFDGGYAYRDWVKLPDAEAVSAAEQWLAAQCKKGDTHVLPALLHALGDERGELTVVVVSDGEFLYEERPSELKKAIKAAQAKRKTKALIGVLGIGHTSKRETLLAIEGGAGYYCVGMEDDDE